MPIPYITVEGVAKSFGDYLMYDNVSFVLNQGERVALIAPNGTGKSTLLDIVAGVDSPDSGVVTLRSGIRIGYLTQQPSLPQGCTLREAIFHSSLAAAEALREYHEAVASEDHEAMQLAIERVEATGGWELEQRAEAILSQLGVRDLTQNVDTLSGGQRKRLALAIVLIDDYDVLILDEPTNHLDLNMSAWLEDYLRDCGKSILMVTHDRYFLENVTTNIYELDNKVLYYYDGGYSDYLQKREQRLILSEKDVMKARNLYTKELDWIRRMPQARGTKAKYRVDAFEDIKKRAFNQTTTSKMNIGVMASRLGTKIFEAKDMNKSFGEKVILRNFSYTFSRYQKLGIVGENGTGKSTFVNILTGEIPLDSGTVDVGQSVKFGYYRQTPDDFREDKKVIEVIKDIAEVITLDNGSTVSASQLLTQFLFSPPMQQSYVGKLSGGERRRLYLITILMRSPNFLVLDEPTNDLDIMTLNVLEDYLENFSGCLIVISHDRYFMDKCVDGLLVFEGGGKITPFSGNYTDYREYSIQQKHAQKESPQSEKPKTTRSVRDNSNKLSFKEKMRLGELEQQIASLEEEKGNIELTLSSGEASGEEIARLGKRYSEVTDLLDEAMMEWMELSEKEG